MMTQDLQKIAHLMRKANRDLFWLPDDVRKVDRPEILYIYSNRNSNSFNQVIDASLEEIIFPNLVDEVCTAHHKNPSRWFFHPDMASSDRTRKAEKILLEHDYKLKSETHGYVSPVIVQDSSPLKDIECKKADTLQHLRDFNHVLDLAFEKPSSRTDNDLKQELPFCQGETPRVVRYIAYDRKTLAPVSAAAMTLFYDLKIGFLWAGCTIKKYRNRGIYHEILNNRINFAAKHGLQFVGLYARVNTSAPIVAKMGFQKLNPMFQFEK